MVNLPVLKQHHNDLMVRCECGEDTVELHGFKDEPWVSIGWFQACYRKQWFYQIYDRIKMAAKVLWYGQHFMVEILMDKKQCESLRDWLGKLEWTND